MSAELAISCSAVVKVYEADKGVVQALRGIDLAARPGTVTAVAGPSGSGKSTLLRLLAAIDSPTAGDVVIGGLQIAGASARVRRAIRRRHIGYVQQRPSDNLFADMPIGEQLRLVARHKGVARSEVGRLAEGLDIADRLGHDPRELSGGEQQRAALARAALGRPSVIIADEPTAELDLVTTRAVCSVLGSLARDRSVAIVVATHDVEVMGAADHVLFLRDGAVQSETFEGRELAVVDSTGRIQLPPEVLSWYPGRRVALEFDPETSTIVIKPT